MTVQHDRPTPATNGARLHHTPAADNMPPTHSKVTAGLAALACAACWALPLLIAAGVLTGAGAALAENILLATSGILVAAAAGMWWLHRRHAARKAATPAPAAARAAAAPADTGRSWCQRAAHRHHPHTRRDQQPAPYPRPASTTKKPT